jgi:hypothetical protein
VDVEWALQLRVVVLLSRVPSKMVSETSTKTGPVMMAKGGMAKKMMAGGGMMKKGYAAGGAVKKKMMAGGGAVRGK